MTDNLTSTDYKLTKITDGYQSNFDTLKRAIRNRDAGLMLCEDVTTGKSVVVVCAFMHDTEHGTWEAIPLAKMFDGNPYEEVKPPVLEGAL